MPRKHNVILTPKQRQHLINLVSVGKNKARVIRRAHILLKSAEGKTDSQIAHLLYISEETVRRTRKQFCTVELAQALVDKPHPERETIIQGDVEAYLIALACTDPPEGYAQWSLELLTQRLLDDGIVSTVSAETVRLSLKKTS